WGDAGQCLISIDDLTTALGDVPETLLPIPSKAALGPAGRQDVAVAEVAAPVSGTPTPDLVRYKQESIRSECVDHPGHCWLHGVCRRHRPRYTACGYQAA